MNHHPSEAMLTAYASGSLYEGLALVIASHASQCPLCQRQLHDLQTVGGILLEDLPPTAMSATALDRAFAQLDQAMPQLSRPRSRPSASPPDNALPAPLSSYLRGELKWRFIAPGIRQIKILPRNHQGGVTRLLRVAPGIALPLHGHTDNEMTLVLSGGFSDEIGRFGPGDVSELDPDTQHRPISDQGSDCICLIANAGPLVINSILGQILQNFL